MEIDILSIFPKMFEGPLHESILDKAINKGLINVKVTDFRDFSLNKHNNVDDYPFGGGAGMLLTPQPVLDAFEHTKQKAKNNGVPSGKVILLDPAGKKFDQKEAEKLSKEEHLTFICGHYEGYDERIKSVVTDEYSIGDFIVTGGELPTMMMIDATARLIPGVLGNNDSASGDSFSNGLLEYPQYTRPANYNGMEVPSVLTSGNHQKIDEWRQKESLRKTYTLRPELIDHDNLTDLQKKLLAEIKSEK
ncbi:tRNA (guanosine(37)-N1)-methyltransferase TrmD [Lactobacillus sp. S2-2]|uniref:tRNA (guanosine(37)-N1)-methyltransferase TrmD n=1 Tax=Lactobacillus sp. S2-2 TaxID=2692917 RepID=UPI001F0042DD|nr:tRNA (guanosine(37)-N1)-methyltransferase TrmD [Lactobacillus sp. S2-2]MCF6515080.1 tRNA (guanosine(37)-N1)-methyltransferase TrmD [Lactobacillus sp. S2-2]